MTIANALRIHHAYFNVSCQSQMLQTVVAHNDLGIWKLRQEVLSSHQAIASNHHRDRTFSVDKQWFITGLRG